MGWSGRAPAPPANEAGEVLTVGEGRGFAVESVRGRLVFTAAHCLPRLSVPYPFAQQERTYWDLLSPLGQAPFVTSECCFVDLVSDLAVLGPPDDQELSSEYNAYEQLLTSSAAMPTATVSTPSRIPFTGWLLSLEGVWFRCSISHNDGGLWIYDSTAPIGGGMSGSPILNEDGAAIGVFVFKRKERRYPRRRRA